MNDNQEEDLEEEPEEESPLPYRSEKPWEFPSISEESFQEVLRKDREERIKNYEAIVREVREERLKNSAANPDASS